MAVTKDDTYLMVGCGTNILKVCLTDRSKCTLYESAHKNAVTGMRITNDGETM